MIILLVIGLIVLGFFMIKHAYDNTPSSETEPVETESDTESGIESESELDSADTEDDTGRETESDAETESDSTVETESESANVVREPTLADLIVGTWVIEGDDEFTVSSRTYAPDGTYRDRVWSYTSLGLSYNPEDHYFYGANWDEKVTDGIVGTWHVEDGKLITEGIDGDDGEFRRVERADVKDGVLTVATEELTYGDYEVWVPGTENMYYGAVAGKWVTAQLRLGDLAVTTYDFHADGSFYCDTRIWMDPENNPGKGYTDWTLLDLDFIGRTGRYEIGLDKIVIYADKDEENGLIATTITEPMGQFFVSFRHIKGDKVSSAELTELKELLKKVDN